MQSQWQVVGFQTVPGCAEAQLSLEEHVPPHPSLIPPVEQEQDFVQHCLALWPSGTAHIWSVAVSHTAHWSFAPHFDSETAATHTSFASQQVEQCDGSQTHFVPLHF